MELLEQTLRLLAGGALLSLLVGCVVKTTLMVSVSARTQRLFPEYWSGLGNPSVFKVLCSPESTQRDRWWDWATKRPVEPDGDPQIAALLVWLDRVHRSLFPLFVAALLFSVPLRWFR